MRKRSYLIGINASPTATLVWLYIVTPIVLVVALYYVNSVIYLADDPNGKLMPSFSMMGRRLWELAIVADSRTHTHLMWADTAASLYRFLTGLSLAAAVGLLLGLNIALFPALEYILLPSVVALSFVPMMALLPILLILVGLGDAAKISLIFLGVVFFITRDIYGTTKEVPQELLVKARTLGATDLGLVYRVVLPMVLPRLFESVRQSLGVAWWALIASEGIAATEGLGYRIFLVRRYFDMAAIIPYVIWITFLAFAFYSLLIFAQRRFFPWQVEGA
jgi:NitT/TauT family transport system permease protein